MPELPEVETVVRELNKKLKGRVIKSVEVRAGKLIGVGPAGLGNARKVQESSVTQFKQLLAKQKIVSVNRRAKLLIFGLFNTALSGPVRHRTISPIGGENVIKMYVHLKMTGQFIFEDRALKKKTGSKYRILNKLSAPLVQLPGKHTHVIFTFTDGSTLYFNDVRKFAYLKIIRDDEIEHLKELQEYGPEPLSKEFTFPVFLTAVKNRARAPIKLVLMDPKVVVGIGNIYSDEILFQAKVRPMRPVSGIKSQELSKIFQAIGPVLKKGIEAKGSSVGDFIRTDGRWGTMGKFHFVYGRKKQPCKVCGTIIESVKLGGRTSCFCPNCQK